MNNNFNAQKIILITFHCALNYGTMLQAYAMLSILKRYCNDVAIYDYRPGFLTLPYKPQFMVLNKIFRIREKRIKSLLRVPLSFVQFYILGNRQKSQKFKSFEDKYFVLTDSSPNNSQDEILVIGSDQMWNPRITNYDKTYFYSNYPHDNLKIITYAASIGIDHPTFKEIDFIRNNIKHIDFISVREESAFKLLTNLCDKPISVVLDPTLLIKATDSEWKQFITDNQYGQYILLYQVVDNKNALKICSAIAKSKNLKIIEILSHPISYMNINCHKHITTAGPEEFVSLIAHAQYVVTTSFHGTAFSINFNKQFVTIAHNTTGSRMQDLLERLGLSDRIVSTVDDLPERDIDYSVVNARLSIERKKSIDFIEKALCVPRVQINDNK